MMMCGENYVCLADLLSTPTSSPEHLAEKSHSNNNESFLLIIVGRICFGFTLLVGQPHFGSRYFFFSILNIYDGRVEVIEDSAMGLHRKDEYVIFNVFL